MMNIAIDHADLVEHTGGARLWMLGLVIERDGEEVQRMFHLLPEETLENMVVEYDLDPTDFVSLLEAALYMPYISDPITHDHPKAPHLVDDPAEAREHLLAQVRGAKGDGRVTGLRGRSTVGAAGPRMRVIADSGVEDPVEVLRREMPLSRPHIEVKREAYERVRARVRDERRAAASAPPRAPGKRESPEELRTRLDPKRAPADR